MLDAAEKILKYPCHSAKFLTMPTNDLAVSVRNLTKTYRLFGHPGDRIKQFLSLGFRKYHQEFIALRDVSFDIKKGETVGIIGRNGSGKSTLLQLICGILKPTSGTVQVNGQVSALLELGAGFNPEFTGRENIYFQGAIIGLSKEEMDKRFDDIAAFAGIGEFIDQPVRIYSSGMFVRLAFAVAINVEPDILVVDEALAVGDAAFQRKCYRKMENMTLRKTTLIFVSHDIESVRRLCQKAIFLQKNTIKTYGHSKSVCDTYEKSMFADSTNIDIFSKKQGDFKSEFNNCELSYGGDIVTIKNCWIENESHEKTSNILYGESFYWNMMINFNTFVAEPYFGMMLKTREGWCVYGADSEEIEFSIDPCNPGDQLHIRFLLINNLIPGTYYLNCSVKHYVNNHTQFLHRRIDSGILNVLGPKNRIGVADLSAKIEIISEFRNHRIQNDQSL